MTDTTDTTTTADNTTTADTGTRPTGYPRKRARTRRLLIEAAMEALAEHGPDAVTVSGIARRARVAPGTFYNHFDDLAAIVAAVVDELAAGVELGGELLREIGHDPAERVTIGTQQLLDLARDQPATARAFVGLLATVPEFRTRVRSAVTTAISDGIDAGRFTARPAAIVADALIGAVVQWMRTRLNGEHDGTPDEGYHALALHIAGLSD